MTTLTEGLRVRGHLHLLERMDHVLKLPDGSGNWASGHSPEMPDEEILRRLLKPNLERVKQ